MAAMNSLTIRMSVRLWNGISSAMDNKANNSRWEYWNSGGDMGDPADPEVGPTSRFAHAIREAGWRQVVDAWQRPDHDEVGVSLTREEWEFIVADAHETVPLYQELAQDSVGQSRQEMLDSAQLCRDTIAVVSKGLRADPPIAP